MGTATSRCLRAAEAVGLTALLLGSAVCGPVGSTYREASGDNRALWVVQVCTTSL